MVTAVGENTFSTVYNDDYADSDHYHRVLFNSGRALQARELTQSQTIIQKEIERIAGFIFRPGGIFNQSYGGTHSGFYPLTFLKIDSFSSITTPSGLVGATLTGTGTSTGVTATVKAVIPSSTDGDGFDTLLVKINTSNNLTSSDTSSGPKIFEAGQTINYSGTSIGSGSLTIQTTDTTANPAVGKGSMVEVPQFNTFAADHLIFVEKQSLVVEKFNAKPNVTIGFAVTEQIIAATDNVALYDNAGTTPNLTSPGADRLQIILTLTKESSVASGTTFYPLYKIISGVVRKLQTPDNVLAELGGIIHTRTSGINGDFIESRKDFSLIVDDDSNSDFLKLKMTGGTAYIKGQRITREILPDLRIGKSRTDPTDVHSVTNQFMTTEFGNYFLADSVVGMADLVDSYGEVNFKATGSVNNIKGGALLGTGRIRGIDKFDSKYRLHMFDINMDSDGAGTTFSIGDIKAIGRDSDNYANISSVDGRVDLFNKMMDTLLFPVGPRVKEITNVTMRQTRISKATSNGSGQVTFSTSSGSATFVDQEQWIVVEDVDGKVHSPPIISGTPGTSAIVTGMRNATACTLLGYESKTATQRIKTLSSDLIDSSLSLDGSNKFSLTKHDIYKFIKIEDDITKEDITYKFVLDNGQRDNFYTLGGGKLKSGSSSPGGTINVKYNHFTHSAGDYFAGQTSYPDVNYENIPGHISKRGLELRLSDTVDMRPTKDNTGANFTGTGAVIPKLPRDTDQITIGTAKYWKPRVDILSLSPSGAIVHDKGISSIVAKAPNIAQENLPLYRINYNPFTLNKKDLDVTDYRQYGYKMSDIQRIEQRVKGLEEATTLTLTEIGMNNLTVPDPNDATLPDRVKQGLTADGFQNNVQSMLSDENYKATIYTNINAVAPMFWKRETPLKYDSAASSFVRQHGSTIWPEFTEEVYISQIKATQFEDVNAFEISKHVGSGFLEPATDAHTKRRVQDANYQSGSSGSYVDQATNTINSQGNQNQV